MELLLDPAKLEAAAWEPGHATAKKVRKEIFALALLASTLEAHSSTLR
jgi:hypothetical protein